MASNNRNRVATIIGVSPLFNKFLGTGVGTGVYSRWYPTRATATQL